MKSHTLQAVIFLFLAAAAEILLAYILRSGNGILEEFALAGEAITGVAAVIALLGFLYQAKQDKDVAAIAIITFYRSDLLPIANKFSEMVLKGLDERERNLLLRRVDLIVFEYWWMRIHHKDIVDKQAEVYQKNKDLGTEVLFLFNALEEFSLRIQYLGLVEHPALASLRDGFISMVEQNAVWILSYLVYVPSGYPGTRKLYEAWRKYGVRTSMDEKMKDAELRIDADLKKYKEVQESSDPVTEWLDLA